MSNGGASGIIFRKSTLRMGDRGANQYRRVWCLKPSFDTNTGAQWHMLPQSYPNYKTVHRRCQTWCRDEVLRRALTDIANELRDSGRA